MWKKLRKILWMNFSANIGMYLLFSHVPNAMWAIWKDFFLEVINKHVITTQNGYAKAYMCPLWFVSTEKMDWDEYGYAKDIKCLFSWNRQKITQLIIHTHISHTYFKLQYTVYFCWKIPSYSLNTYVGPIVHVWLHLVLKLFQWPEGRPILFENIVAVISYFVQLWGK